MHSGQGTLLIDDIRNDYEAEAQANVPRVHKVARNFFDGIKYLDRGLPWETLILDHDLSSYDEAGQEKTGYDVVKWLAEHQELLPKRIFLITSSPPGLANMGSVLERLGYVKIHPRDFVMVRNNE